MAGFPPAAAIVAALTMVLTIALATSAHAEDKALMLSRMADHNMNKLGTRSLALSQIEQALKVEPTNSKFWRIKARILFKMDECEDALTCVETSIKYDPGNIEGLRLKAKFLHSLKRDKEALAYLDQADAAGGPWQDPTRAEIYMALERYDDAEKELDKILALDPTKMTTRNRKADLYFMTKQWQKAIAAETFLLTHSTAPYARIEQLNRRAQCYMNLKQYKKAIEDYHTALKITPEARDVHANLLKAYTLSGDRRAPAEKKYLESLDADYQLYK